MKKEIFIKAHNLTKGIIKKGDSYRATFKLCLSFVYSQIKKGVNKMINYTTSKGSKVSVELIEGTRTIKNLKVNGIELIKNNSKSIVCFLTEGCIFINCPNAKKILGIKTNGNILVESNEELNNIYKEITDREIEKNRRWVNYATKFHEENSYTFEKHLTYINADLD